MNTFIKKHIKKVMVATLSLGLLVGLAGCGKTPQERADKFAARVSDKLELNETQEALLSTLKDNALAASLDLKKSKQGIHSDFIELISLNSIPAEKMNQFTDDNMALIQAKIKSVIPSFVAFHASLNAEQKEEVITFITEHKKNRD